MKNLFNFTDNWIISLLITFTIAVFAFMCLNGCMFFLLEIEKSNLSEIRYCPQCGIDILERR